MWSEAPRSDNIMAKKFRFRLETVRKIRQRERDAQRLVVVEKARAAEAMQSRIGMLAKRMGDNADESREVRGAGPLTVGLLRRHELHNLWLGRVIESSGELLDDRLGELRQERGKLAEAATRLKAIEKLRERQWEAYRDELAREERQAGDEAAQQIFWRKHMGAKAS